jgi:hypothetical protein
MFVRSEKIDPKDYPFNKFHDEQKHLDTDESRHLIKPVVHIIDQDLKGQEHRFCDKEQLCPLGKFRRPKILVESERRGFASVMEMMEADKKAEEDKKVQEVDELKKQLATLTAMIEKIPSKYKGI